MGENQTQELAGTPGADGQPFMSLPQYDCIHPHPGILFGKPVIKGTRIGVELIQSRLAAGCTVAEILEQYPHRSERAVRQAALHEGDTGPLVKLPPDDLFDDEWDDTPVRAGRVLIFGIGIELDANTVPGGRR